MTFQQALYLLMNGSKVTRKSWLTPGHVERRGDALWLVQSGCACHYYPVLHDLLAIDWEVA